MKLLYHFTSLFNLENVGPDNILVVGLRERPVRDWWFLEGRAGVWLTTNPDLPSDARPHASYSEVRIEVRIPSSDRALVDIPKLMRRHLSPAAITNVDLTGWEWRNFYLYEGDIPVDRFVAVEYADAARREEIIMKRASPED